MVGKFQAYSEYKDSGAEWLGEIPSHWNCIKLKYVVNLEGDKIEPGSTHKYVGMENIESWSGKYIQKEDAKPEGLSTSFSNGDVLFGKLRPYLAKSWLANFSGICSSELLVFRCTKVSPKFLNYYSLTEEFIKQVDSSTYGSKMPRASWDFISLLGVPVPAIADSEKIANFLDHETAKIDTLIDKQQQLIALLKEKRQAVISHSVTKGLTPNVPLRESGVEWLGEVPAHWSVAQLKFNTLEMQTGPFGSQLHAEDYVVDGIPLINPAHMTAGKILPDSKVTVDKDTQERLSRHKLAAGEIIFARRGELGRCAIVTNEQEGWLCGTGSLKAKLNGRLIPEYAYLLITSDGVISELSLESKGSTMDNLNTETLGRVRLPVPPPKEQRAILIYVESIAGKYESLISKAESAINLIQERRTALISAAVTGKIDVRNWEGTVNESTQC
ncbi:MAG: restriction endonuclease subunit S [Alteromonadaceae bacterium]|uniref:restriction endonuclease subunit S n=1 Tax=Paraglaciecola chathamensis TaxID=368405 RepID=UPI000C5F3EF1|nr:restriction endonuclease subunit S [Paraglaciecola agarilytica]MBN28044.1 restriction endonuclease subunit S [Alteromonadaceae bacterium]|tara:strand:+ start:53881 stop:55209 length:1329 start_codon:yes stop_codon:yes gene_type:complete